MKPYEKLVYGVQNQLSSASETVPCISVEDIDSNLYGCPEPKAFLSRTILKIISKIGTYSYCTPLLICVGDCTTVLVVWLPIILKYIIAGE